MQSNLAYQAEVREELLQGAVVAMSPRPAFNHNRISENIYFLFRIYLKGKKCVPFGDGYDLFLTDEDQFVPDMMVVCDRDKIKPDGVHGAPDLVVEVLSPSTVKRDRGYKKDVYAACGVREYWIVDSASRTVEQYLLRDGQLVLHEAYAVHPDWMLDRMTPEEREAVITRFHCSLYDDLELSLDDIFSGLLP